MSGLQWWARSAAPNAATAGCGHGGGAAAHQGKAGATMTTSSSSSSSSDNNNNAASSTNCCGLSKLLKKMIKKRCSKMLKTAGRQSSFQCRYDPLSYSLNFDTSGCGSLLDEDCQYRLYAFSSRFAASSRADCQTLMATRSH